DMSPSSFTLAPETGCPVVVSVSVRQTVVRPIAAGLGSTVQRRAISGAASAAGRQAVAARQAARPASAPRAPAALPRPATAGTSSAGTSGGDGPRLEGAGAMHVHRILPGREHVVVHGDDHRDEHDRVVDQV